MAKYRKKPVIIDAWKFDGRLDYSKTLPKEIKDATSTIRLTQDGKLRIKTLEGDMFAEQGDFIIKGVKGEFYPCKPDIFEQTYEPINSKITDYPAEVNRLAHLLHSRSGKLNLVARQRNKIRGAVIEFMHSDWHDDSTVQEYIEKFTEALK